MKKFAAVVSALLLGLSLWAAPLTVTWIDGKVEKQKGSAWLAIKEGDVVDSADTIRLAKGAMAELTMGARKITLSAAGTYSLDSVVKAGAQVQKSSGTMDKIAKIVAPPASQQTAVGGVRGDLIGAGVDKTSWAGDDEELKALIEKAKGLVTEKKYSEALAVYAKASESAEGDMLDQVRYGQAFSLAASGSPLRAIKILRAMPATGVIAGPRALLLARLDLDTGSVDEAKAVLNAVISANSLAGDDLDLAKAMLKESGTTK